MIRLTIEDPIVPEALPKNVYVLNVQSYHGDGDYDEETQHTFEPKAEQMEKLHLFLEIFEAYIAAGQPYAITRKDWVKFINEQNIDTSSVTYIEDWISELLAWDMTNDGQYLTTFRGYDLWFYDVNGLKRPVTVERTNGNS